MTIAEKLEDSNPVNQKRISGRPKWVLPVILFAILVLAVLIYYGIGYLLVRQVDILYDEKNCVGLLPLAESVEQFYPLKVAPFTGPALEQVAECRLYLQAEALFGQKAWAKAYRAYQKYQTTYSNGIFSKEAKALAADSLFAWAVEQRGKQEYASAVNNLILLLDEYSDTPSMPKAKAALPEVYFEWGEECRSKNEFSEAETVYLSLNAWAIKEKEQVHSTRARTELAQTYFEWGKVLQSDKNFPLASKKLESVLSTDPTPQSANSPAAQTRAYLPGFQRAWGEHLIKLEKFQEAIEHYKTSVLLSSPEDLESAKDVLAAAYLEWASALQRKEDFHQALDMIELAHASSATDESRKNTDTERANTLDLFSRSKGIQAQKIISDVTKSTCEKGQPAETLPIIGVLDEKRLTIFGVETNWSSNLIAQVPGNLHYVACIKTKEIKVQTCPYSELGSGYYGISLYQIERIRYEWRIKIFRAPNGILLKEKIFQGSVPETCPWTHFFSFMEFTHYHYGGMPSTQEIENWLSFLLK